MRIVSFDSVDLNETVGLDARDGPEEAVDIAYDCRACGQSQCENRDGHSGVEWTPNERPNCQPGSVVEDIEHWDRLLLVQGLTRVNS